MPNGCKRILGLFTERKKRKAWNKTGVKYMPVKIRQNLPETDKGSMVRRIFRQQMCILQW